MKLRSVSLRIHTADVRHNFSNLKSGCTPAVDKKVAGVEELGNLACSWDIQRIL